MECVCVCVDVGEAGRSDTREERGQRAQTAATTRAHISAFISIPTKQTYLHSQLPQQAKAKKKRLKFSSLFRKKHKCVPSPMSHSCHVSIYVCDTLSFHCPSDIPSLLSLPIDNTNTLHLHPPHSPSPQGGSRPPAAPHRGATRGGGHPLPCPPPQPGGASPFPQEERTVRTCLCV